MHSRNRTSQRRWLRTFWVAMLCAWPAPSDAEPITDIADWEQNALNRKAAEAMSQWRGHALESEPGGALSGSDPAGTDAPPWNTNVESPPWNPIFARWDSADWIEQDPWTHEPLTPDQEILALLDDADRHPDTPTPEHGRQARSSSGPELNAASLTVPEPAVSAFLAAAGLVLLLAWRRQRLRNTARG